MPVQPFQQAYFDNSGRLSLVAFSIAPSCDTIWRSSTFKHGLAGVTVEMQPDKVRVFDFQATIGRLADDVELYREMVRFYVDDSPLLVAELQTGLQEQDAAQIERAAHTLKGMSSTFDGKRVMAVAAEVEQLARSGQLAGIEPQLAALGTEARRLREALLAFEPPGR
jgi:HPt (histidine-containing phosphotransfer) domain-containing protein